MVTLLACVKTSRTADKNIAQVGVGQNGENSTTPENCKVPIQSP